MFDFKFYKLIVRHKNLFKNQFLNADDTFVLTGLRILLLLVVIISNSGSHIIWDTFDDSSPVLSLFSLHSWRRVEPSMTSIEVFLNFSFSKSSRRI